MNLQRMIVHLIWGVVKALDQGEHLQGSHGNQRQEILVHQLPGLVHLSNVIIHEQNLPIMTRPQIVLFKP